MNLISKKVQKLVIAVSEREDGSMRFLGDKRERQKTLQNRRNFLRKLGVKPEQVVSAGLVHESHIAVVDEKDAGKHIRNTDGLITADSDLFLALTVADCLPVFLFAPENKALGLIHAGWRPLAEEILKKACQKMTVEFGTRPEGILAGVGPGICQMHYEVKEDVASKFADYKECIKERDDRLYLDLKGVAKTQLQACDVKSSNIRISAECTYELPQKYFSYRRCGEPIRTMLVVFGRMGE